MTVSHGVSRKIGIFWYGKHDTMWSIHVKSAEGETYEKRNFELHTEQELSWLRFNQRVLEEAQDESVPASGEDEICIDLHQ